MGAYTRTTARKFRKILKRTLTGSSRFCGERRVRQPGRTLSGGEQQMLAMARALMARPKMLVMDEPSMGLAPVFVEKSFELIQELNRQGYRHPPGGTECQHGPLAIANRGYAWQNGHIVLQDTAQNLIHHPMMRKAYLEL